MSKRINIERPETTQQSRCTSAIYYFSFRQSLKIQNWKTWEKYSEWYWGKKQKKNMLENGKLSENVKVSSKQAATLIHANICLRVGGGQQFFRLPRSRICMTWLCLSIVHMSFYNFLAGFSVRLRQAFRAPFPYLCLLVRLFILPHWQISICKEGVS